MKCFYHSADLDGHCSGAIVKMKYPDCEMIGINYGDEFPWDSIPVGCGEQIFMVDFSLQPYPRMRTLDIHADPLVWIDHHKSAVDEHKQWLEKGRGEILGVQKSGIGACQLTWEHLYGYESLPTFIKLLAEYDVWDHSDPRTLSFQYGMRQQENTLPGEQEFWRSLFDVEEVQRITEVGGIVSTYQVIENKKYARACAFETKIDGFECIAVNKMLTNSQIFDSVWDSKKHDVMLSFGWRKGQWHISMYSDKDNIDVGAIAAKRGGGGHKGAAGFQCNVLPFVLS